MWQSYKRQPSPKTRRASGWCLSDPMRHCGGNPVKGCVCVCEKRKAYFHVPAAASFPMRSSDLCLLYSLQDWANGWSPPVHGSMWFSCCCAGVCVVPTVRQGSAPAELSWWTGWYAGISYGSGSTSPFHFNGKSFAFAASRLSFAAETVGSKMIKFWPVDLDVKLKQAEVILAMYLSEHLPLLVLLLFYIICLWCCATLCIVIEFYCERFERLIFLA